MTKCDKCGTLQYEWETALSGLVTCSNCGEPLNRPEPTRKPTRKLKILRGAPAVSPQADEEPAAAAAPNAPAAAMDSDSILATELRHMIDTNIAVKTGIAITPTLISWVVMLAIGIPLAWFRYGPMIPVHWHSMFQYWGFSYGPLLFLGIHLMITLLSFKDDFSKGLLCIFVPLYSFYYLMTLPDNHILRTLVFILIVLLGVDTYHGTAQILAQHSDQISAWISGHEYEAGYE